MCIRNICSFLLVLGVLFGYAANGSAEDFLLVVNKGNAFSENTEKMKKTVKKLFLRNQKRWANNSVTAKPLCRAEGSAEEIAFNRAILGMSTSRLDSYWLKRKQRYGDSPPDRIKSTTMLLRLVKRSKGAFGVVRADQAANLIDGVRVLFAFSSSGKVSAYHKPVVAPAPKRAVAAVPPPITPKAKPIITPPPVAVIAQQSKTPRPLSLKIKKPKTAMETTRSKLQVTGKLSGDWRKGSLRVMAKAVTPKANGAFSVRVNLALGKNKVVVKAQAKDGKVVRKTITIIRIQALALTLHQGGKAQAIGNKITFSGRLVGGKGKRVLKVGNQRITVAKNGKFHAEINGMSGKKTITLVATAGQEKVKKRLKIVTDSKGIRLLMGQPKNGDETLEKTIVIGGTVSGGDGALTLTINGKAYPVKKGKFSTSIPLSVGANSLRVAARDEAGRSLLKSLTVTRKKALSIVLTQGEYYFSKQPTVTVIGKIAGGLGKWSLQVDGKPVSVKANGVFRAKVSVRKGEHKVAVKATDSTGTVVSKTIRVVGG